MVDARDSGDGLMGGLEDVGDIEGTDTCVLSFAGGSLTSASGWCFES